MLTPEKVQKMNWRVRVGEREPYVFIGYTETDYLVFGAWLNDLLRVVQHQSAVIDAYEADARAANQRSAPGE